MKKYKIRREKKMVQVILHKLVDSVLLPLLESTTFLLTIGCNLIYCCIWSIICFNVFFYYLVNHQDPHQRFFVPGLYTAATLPPFQRTLLPPPGRLSTIIVIIIIIIFLFVIIAIKNHYHDHHFHHYYHSSPGPC